MSLLILYIIVKFVCKFVVHIFHLKKTVLYVKSQGLTEYGMSLRGEIYTNI